MSPEYTLSFTSFLASCIYFPLFFGKKEQYIKNKEFDNEAYQKWIISYLQTYKKGKKRDFIDLLGDKLPDTLNEKQKESKVRNILNVMRQKGIITTDSQNKRLANWILKPKNN